DTNKEYLNIPIDGSTIPSAHYRSNVTKTIIQTNNNSDSIPEIRGDVNTNTTNITSNDADILINSTQLQDSLPWYPTAQLVENTPKTYYVSPNGSDTNDGSLDSPWLTIAKVTSSMGSFIGRDRVAFQGGGVYNDAMLRITSDSLTITSYGSGDKPVISALQTLTSPSSEGGGVYSYSTTDRIMQVFQDGEYLYPSRFPDSRDTTALYISDIAANTFTDTIDLADITPGAIIHIKNQRWTMAHLDIDSYGVGGAARDTIVYDNSFGSHTPSANYGYYITGVTSEIDDGEWSYNTDEDKLYIDLLRGDLTAEITATNIDTCINILADFITIENIEVRGANDVGIGLESTGDFFIDNVDFYYCNRYAIHSQDFEPSSVTVKNCSFYYGGAKAIRFVDANNVVVQDNFVFGHGTWIGNGDIYGNGKLADGYGDAFNFWSCDGVVVRNNVFEQVARSAIFTQRASNTRTLIESNDIHRTMLFSGDGGAIYTDNDKAVDSAWDTIRNNTIIRSYGSFKGNINTIRASDGIPESYGIYLDEAEGTGAFWASKYVLQGNKIDSVGKGIFLHEVDSIYVIDNEISNVESGIILVDYNSGLACEGEGVFIYRNVIRKYLQWPMRWADFDDAANTYPYLDYNVVIGQSERDREEDVYFYTDNTTQEDDWNLWQWRTENSDTAAMNSVHLNNETQYKKYGSAGVAITKTHYSALLSMPELHVNANASADGINSTETNGTAGFTNNGLLTFDSQTSQTNAGTYAMHFVANSDGDRAYVDLSAAPFNIALGDHFIISFDIRHVGSGDAWVASLRSSNFGIALANEPTRLVDLINTETAWQTITNEFVATSDMVFLVIRENSGSDDGGVYFDNLSIKEIWNNESPEYDPRWENITVTGIIYVIDATGNDTLLIYDDGDTARIFSNNNPIKIGEGSLVVGTDGNVGIGESSPLDILHV
ncbi:hypothetical protein LCGC14_1755760, partial [marine sediment metagenome]